ncbi:MAG: site-2 protease family protein [Acidobacteria bacterium]|nr:MAG: site-2 protease family protein [Acidobacteriota bacterium]
MWFAAFSFLMAGFEQFTLSDRLPWPTLRTWLRHTAFLLATLVTSTIAGVLFPFGVIDPFPKTEPQSIAEFIPWVGTLPAKYLALIGSTITTLFNDSSYLAYGLSFSLSLLFILISHEMGHYIACRIYRVDATLPYFIPTPPMIGPAGTFGAFIKIKSPMPSRKAVFDIGVAGPIAGFVALLPIAIIGVFTMQPASTEQLAYGNRGLEFSNSLLMKIIFWVSGIDYQTHVNSPLFYAAWVGILVTALNLIPSGQLDGGHAIYAVFGERIHYWTGRIAFVAMAIFSILGWIYFNSPSGFLFTVLLGIMMRIKHPTPWDETPLDRKRKIVSILTLLIFALCFVPFPIQIN